MRYFKIKILATLIAAFCVAQGAFAQLSQSGTWNATEITTNVTVSLTGNITIKGSIDIKNGATLTINANGANRSLSYDETPINNIGLFIIRSGGKLVINGAQNARITLDGAANFTFEEGTSLANHHNLTTTKNVDGFRTRAIYNYGTLELNYVTIQNFKSEYDGAGILIGAYRANGSKTPHKTGTTTIKNSIIQRCWSPSGSAIMYSTQSAEDDVDNPNINPEECKLTIENTTIKECYAENNDTGGTVRTNGGTVGSIYMTNVTFENNFSNASGGGLYWNGHGRQSTKCVLDGCHFKNNMAVMRGGGAMLEATFEFTGNPTTIENNLSVNGGGIIITGYGGGNDTEENYNLAFDFGEKLIVRNNKATSNGGGIGFVFGSGMTLPIGSTITANLVGATISGNEAGNDGGGLHFTNSTDPERNYTININLNHGSLKSNKAINGAGIYVEKENLNSNITAGKQLQISGNEASQNGGGIYVANGTVKLEAGQISDNTATHYGGGLYVANTEASTVTFSGGTFDGNTAFAGGGACVSGPITLSISNSNFQNNTALNGGGIFLTGGATMNYGSGLIRNNIASNTTDTDTGTKGDQAGGLATAYRADVPAAGGIGGGVYLDSNTSLTFTASEGLGLYGNHAYSGADDIFANGNSTSVQLPNVAGMTLTEFQVPVAQGSLYWVKDYITNDTNYAQAPKGTGEENLNAGNVRYRYALSNMQENYYKLEPQAYTGYISVALGYELIFITINKTGLSAGENAIFTITKKNDTAPYMTVVLQGNGNNASKKISLPGDTWTIAETGWSWTYNTTLPDTFAEDGYSKSDNSYTRPLSQEKIKQNGAIAIFNFNNEKKPNLPLYDEAIKVNTLKAQ